MNRQPVLSEGHLLYRVHLKPSVVEGGAIPSSSSSELCHSNGCVCGREREEARPSTKVMVMARMRGSSWSFAAAAAAPPPLSSQEVVRPTRTCRAA